MKNYLHLSAPLRTRNFSYYKQTLRIPHYTISRLDDTILCESVSDIVHWVLKQRMEYYGSGLEVMPNMIEC